MFKKLLFLVLLFVSVLPVNADPVSSVMVELNNRMQVMKVGELFLWQKHQPFTVGDLYLHQTSGTVLKIVCFLNNGKHEPNKLVFQNVTTGDCHVMKIKTFADTYVYIGKGQD